MPAAFVVEIIMTYIQMRYSPVLQQTLLYSFACVLILLTLIHILFLLRLGLADKLRLTTYTLPMEMVLVLSLLLYHIIIP